MKDGFKFDLMKASEKDSNEEYGIYFNISLALNKMGEMFSE